MTIENYKWVPGQGPSAEAIDRMLTEFSMPSTPMGEAWFISEVRTMYLELMERPIAEIPTDLLQRILWELTSGTSCFGHLDEWDEWFRFLLPHLILRSQDTHISDTILECTITASFNIFDKGLPNDYPKMREDIIATVPRCLMKPELWVEWKDETFARTALRPAFLVDEDGQITERWWWGQTTVGAVSAAMFFCLRFLEPQEIASWVKSLTDIQDSFWKGHLLVWLIGFDKLTLKLPFTTKVFERLSPLLKWSDSYLVDAWKEGKAFFPPENIKAFWEEINRQITAVTLLQWVDEFAAQPIFADNHFYIPDIYFDQFICKQS
ncbi:MAG: hypothetical protein U0Y68_25310 [Blastocatellia bacterium]